GVVGALARAGARLDALGLRVQSHQRVGYRDRGTSVSDGDGEEVGQCAFEAPPRVGVDARAVGDRGRKVGVEVPDSAPREYREALRKARSSIVLQAELLAKAGIALESHLERLDPALLGHTMLSFAEMLGRLAVSEPDTYPRERLETYAVAALKLLGARD
ncbi:MAG: transcriptional regulator, partial [Mycobacterium sp.]|nr:transcriptional regulator [Mycobacterium sp.]